MESKSPGIAALLALLIGIGVFGIGHIYVGRIRRGIVLLVVSLAIHVPLVMAAVLLIPSLFLSREAFGALFIGVVVLGLVNLGLWIWQGYDAYKLAKQFNEHVRQYGKVPW
jgi:TM2 domain-containing membrane protein YozV